jgi:antitoxin (DNA-binding transcriptional repressor) of toxin-antitoxin stability system
MMTYAAISSVSAKTVGAAQFKERGLALLDEVGPEGTVVTKHGKPVAKLIPSEADSADLSGSLKNEIEVKGDILSTGVTWNAES